MLTGILYPQSGTADPCQLMKQPIDKGLQKRDRGKADLKHA